MNSKKTLETSMVSEKTNSKRRQLLTTVIGLGTASTMLPDAWTKPIINSIVLPAHAQMSPVDPPPPPPPPPPAPTCVDIEIGDARISPVSPQTTPDTCAVSFELRSSDPAVTIEIISVTDDSTASTVTTSSDAPGDATNMAGVEVRWQGPTSGAPFCAANDTILTGDVTFTVTASCEAIGDDMFMQEITLSDVLQNIELGNT